MAAPYLNEIRTGGEVKQRLREITYDVANEFGVHGAVDPRPVPHVTLFGPYNTDRGREAKRIVKDVLSDYDIVPYRIDGFERFKQNKVIYANVVPSPELRNLRRELSRRLRPISYNYQPYDSDYFYDFHITIAYKDVAHEFDAIWEYVNKQYDIRFDEYATRVTSLRRRDMMWEYDLLQNQELRPNEATSAKSWEQTTKILNEMKSPNDHDKLAPKPNTMTRFAKSGVAKITRRW
jgi:2'-5' RNA ligase